MKQYGEPWADCAICGFPSPQSQLVKHYRTKLWVDARCNDLPSHADNLERLKIRAEAGRTSVQPVANQGQDGISAGWGTQPWGQTPWGD